MRRRVLSVTWVLSVLSLLSLARAADVEEFKVKREPVFEFVQKPKVTRAGDNVTIAFETKAFCDVTIAIEDASGPSTGSGQARIIRHLVSGVLGPKAPPPLQANTKKQSVVWDGKNDQDVYVDDKDSHTVRVSLGLKPQFERTLFWSPYKRIGYNYPVITSASEGVYVAEGNAVEQIRLFDHQGNYQRTVYPFPSDKVDKVVGLTTHTFIQTGQTLPLKKGYHQATLLPCGYSWWNRHSEDSGYAVNAMAETKGRLALVNLKLNRLALDGTSGGLKLEGPQTTILGPAVVQTKESPYKPLSAALSPDGKWLYLTGYEMTWRNGAGYDGMSREWLTGVFRMPYAEDREPQLFAGGTHAVGREAAGVDSGFKFPTSVACDSKGRVYVSDFMGDRLQVFDADGKLLKSIPVSKPARVVIHQKTDDIYVFSWMLNNQLITTDKFKVDATLTHLGPFDNPAVKSQCPLPLEGYNPHFVSFMNYTHGLQHRVELDSWAEPPTVWVVNGAIRVNENGGVQGISEDFERGGGAIFEEKEGKLVPRRKLADEVKKTVQRHTPPSCGGSACT